LAVAERFARRIGKPVKQCVRVVSPWEMRKEIARRLDDMLPRFDAWRNSGAGTLAAVYHKAEKTPPAEHNGFARHDLCRWDDYGWSKRLPHGYWLHLLCINPTARYGMPVSIGLDCYGIQKMKK